MNRSSVGLTLMALAVIIMVVQIKGCVSSSGNYETEVGCYWSLAAKSSTLKDKLKYTNMFITNLKKIKHSDYNTVFYKNYNNSFDANLDTVISLRNRLIAIQNMDEKSFAYQTAIQQITQQEQRESCARIRIFQGCYDLENYWYTWNWLGGLVFLFYLIMFIVGTCIVSEDW